MSEGRREVFAIGAVGRSAMVLTLAVGLGQVFGIGRELFVASQVGIGPGLDALLVALVFPTMLLGMLMSGTAAAVVPAYVAVEQAAGTDQARRFVGALLTYTVLIGVALTLSVVTLGPIVVGIAGPGLSPTARAAAEGFLVIMAPIIVFGSTAGLISALCQIGQHFVPISVASILSPAVGFVVTVGFWSQLGLTALALGTTVGSFVSVVVLLLGAVRFGLLPRPRLRVDLSYLGDFLRHAIPLWASSAVLQLNLLADRAVSSLLAVGAVSALRYGEGIIRIPLSSIGPAWGMVLYPSLVRVAQAGSRNSLGEASVASFRYVFAIFIPLSVACAAMAPLIVDVAYRRGAFGAEAASATSGVAAALAPMIVLTMVEGILVGAHNAKRRGTLLLATGIANTAIHLVLDLALGRAIGVAGIALSTSLTTTIVFVFLAVRLARTESAFHLREVADSGTRALLASLVAGLPIGAWVWGAYRPGSFGEDLLLLVALTMVGFVVYVAASTRLGLPEPATVVRTLARRLPIPSVRP